MSLIRNATLVLLVLGTALGTLVAAPIQVRFAEGVAHGFLLVRSLDGTLVATGDLLQIIRGEVIEKRMVFQFTDGSVFEESVVYTQQGVYTMQSYGLLQRGPTFTEDIEISLERATGKYRVKTMAHEEEREETLEGTIEDLPLDVYNGMILTVVKDLPAGAGDTVHYVAFTPAPRLIQLELALADDAQKVMVGDLTKTAIHYVLKPQLGIWLEFFATLLGHSPPDEHVWIIPDQVPAFVRFEGPLYPTGPVLRIELTSPRLSE